uniref:Uncharacterized protein n=1 Tax=Anguilla anguilla TaxID=7936 RepID=A0A0E9QG58_ANGAN
MSAPFCPSTLRTSIFWSGFVCGPSNKCLVPRMP